MATFDGIIDALIMAENVIKRHGGGDSQFRG